jgi:hypothetical protein
LVTLNTRGTPFAIMPAWFFSIYRCLSSCQPQFSIVTVRDARCLPCDSETGVPLILRGPRRLSRPLGTNLDALSCVRSGRYAEPAVAFALAPRAARVIRDSPTFSAVIIPASRPFRVTGSAGARPVRSLSYADWSVSVARFRGGDLPPQPDRSRPGTGRRNPRYAHPARKMRHSYPRCCSGLRRPLNGGLLSRP